MKVDADTFLFPENLRRYVRTQGWSPDERHYFGHRLMHTDRPGQAPIVAGAAVGLSRAAVEGLAAVFRGFAPNIGNRMMNHCGDAHLANGEEVVMAVCLRQHLNVSAHHALDADLKELVSIFPIGLGLTFPRDDGHWYWQRRTAGAACCSDTPVALHDFKDPRLLYEIQREVYDPMNPARVGTRSEDLLHLYGPDPDRTLDYLARVRAAMNAKEAPRAREERREGG